MRSVWRVTRMPPAQPTEEAREVEGDAVVEGGNCGGGGRGRCGFRGGGGGGGGGGGWW